MKNGRRTECEAEVCACIALGNPFEHFFVAHGVELVEAVGVGFGTCKWCTELVIAAASRRSNGGCGAAAQSSECRSVAHKDGTTRDSRRKYWAVARTRGTEIRWRSTEVSVIAARGLTWCTASGNFGTCGTHANAAARRRVDPQRWYGTEAKEQHCLDRL